MKKIFKFGAKALLLLIIIATVSCRKEQIVINSTSTGVTEGVESEIKGFFLLNEGNMGSNKATLDYFDYSTGVYSKNIFAERNPMVAYELGDVGNDLKVWGGRLYAVINCSNLVEVMDLSSAEHIGAVSIPNCRYITFEGGYLYVSSYAGEVEVNNPNARLGYVAKVDSATLEVVATCDVGYQPEEMVVVDGRLYVANSGGYMAPNYDNRVSIIDLDTFSLIQHIEVAENLHHLECDSQGFIWIASRGNYSDVPSMTYLFDPSTQSVVGEFDIPNSNMTIAGDSLYVISNSIESSTTSYAIINTSTRSVVNRSFIDSSVESKISIPYGIAVNPISGEIFITDAGNYVTPGVLYCFDKEGAYKWSTVTGDIPASIAFTRTELQPI